MILCKSDGDNISKFCKKDFADSWSVEYVSNISLCLKRALSLSVTVLVCANSGTKFSDETDGLALGKSKAFQSHFFFTKISAHVALYSTGVIFLCHVLIRNYASSTRQVSTFLGQGFLDVVYDFYPVGTRGIKSRMCPPYPHACRKRRLKWGAVI